MKLILILLLWVERRWLMLIRHSMLVLRSLDLTASVSTPKLILLNRQSFKEIHLACIVQLMRRRCIIHLSLLLQSCGLKWIYRELTLIIIVLLLLRQSHGSHLLVTMLELRYLLGGLHHVQILLLLLHRLLEDEPIPLDYLHLMEIILGAGRIVHHRLVVAGTALLILMVSKLGWRAVMLG